MLCQRLLIMVLLMSLSGGCAPYTFRGQGDLPANMEESPGNNRGSLDLETSGSGSESIDRASLAVPAVPDLFWPDVPVHPGIREPFDPLPYPVPGKFRIPVQKERTREIFAWYEHVLPDYGWEKVILAAPPQRPLMVYQRNDDYLTVCVLATAEKGNQLELRRRYTRYIGMPAARSIAARLETGVDWELHLEESYIEYTESGERVRPSWIAEGIAAQGIQKRIIVDAITGEAYHAVEAPVAGRLDSVVPHEAARPASESALGDYQDADKRFFKGTSS